MIPILILLAIVSLALIALSALLIGRVRISSKYKPLFPFVLGIGVGIVCFFIPRLAFTLREAVLFGIASGGLSTIIYDVFKARK